MSNPERPQTCIASARLSSTQQVAGESMELQVKALENYAAVRDWELLPSGKVFEEIGTATKRRKLFEDHLAYIREHPGKVGYYLIPCIDRLSRAGTSEYEAMKRELRELNVVLVDERGIIQESKNLTELDNLGFNEYEWGYESPSEISETILSTQAKIERDTILRRTIPKQITYTQKGYQIGRPDDGYVNQKVVAGTQIRFIQASDPERAHFFKKIFELRAGGQHTDQEILRILNDDMGFRTKTFNRWNKAHTEIIGQGGGKKLQIKQLQRIYQRFAYAGVLCEKWTHNKPIKAQWDGLVSIELWNKANRGKIFIKEYDDNLLEILYDYKTEKPVFQRLRYNPEYPFKCVACPQCGSPLKGSAPKGRGGRYPQYHCARGHKSFSVSRQQMNETVEQFLKGVEYDSDYLKVLEEVLVRKLRKRQKDAVQESEKLNERVTLLKSQQGKTLETLVNTESSSVKQMLEKQLENIERDIKKAESVRFSVDLTEDNIAELISYAKKIVELPEKALIDKDNPLRQKQLFQLFFEDLPTYQELVSGTAKKRFLFNTKCVVETPQNDRESQKGRLPGIEPGQPVPQTGALTVTP